MVEVGVDVTISVSLVGTLVSMVSMVTLVPVISIVSSEPMNVDCGGSVRGVNLEQIPGRVLFLTSEENVHYLISNIGLLVTCLSTSSKMQVRDFK